MEPLWREGIWWWSYYAGDHRANWAALIGMALDRLRAYRTLAELNAAYVDWDSTWIAEEAQRRFPHDSQVWDTPYTESTAFGLRYLELISGQRIDPAQVPTAWLREWVLGPTAE